MTDKPSEENDEETRAFIRALLTPQDAQKLTDIVNQYTDIIRRRHQRRRLLRAAWYVLVAVTLVAVGLVVYFA